MSCTVIIGSEEDKEQRRERVHTSIARAKKAVMKPCFSVEQGIALRKMIDEIEAAVGRAI